MASPSTRTASPEETIMRVHTSIRAGYGIAIDPNGKP